MANDHNNTDGPLPRLDLDYRWVPNPNALVWLYTDGSRVIDYTTLFRDTAFDGHDEDERDIDTKPIDNDKGADVAEIGDDAIEGPPGSSEHESDSEIRITCDRCGKGHRKCSGGSVGVSCTNCARAKAECHFSKKKKAGRDNGVTKIMGGRDGKKDKQLASARLTQAIDQAGAEMDEAVGQTALPPHVYGEDVFFL